MLASNYIWPYGTMDSPYVNGSHSQGQLQSNLINSIVYLLKKKQEHLFYSGYAFVLPYRYDVTRRRKLISMVISIFVGFFSVYFLTFVNIRLVPRSSALKRVIIKTKHKREILYRTLEI